MLQQFESGYAIAHKLRLSSTRKMKLTVSRKEDYIGKRTGPGHRGSKNVWFYIQQCGRQGQEIAQSCRNHPNLEEKETTFFQKIDLYRTSSVQTIPPVGLECTCFILRTLSFNCGLFPALPVSSPLLSALLLSR